LKLAPSYKEIALSLLNNDFSRILVKNQKSKYYHLIKRDEINKKKGKQKLF